MTTTAAYADAPDLAGTDLGWTDWIEITQDRVDLFADATDDHQWIHVDPERAAAGPFGRPIAHGFLSLSLTVRFWSELFELDGVGTKVNYGLEKVRFVSPVAVGARIRGGAVIAEVLDIPGGYQFTVDQTIEIEGAPKPAVVARGLYRFYA
ncbi:MULTISPECIES: MaoC family dehydratase [Microbacterium]|uniref:MaoC family dehydratase n=1 Tax=Microbacterium TaxID=33882 RepID=UPI0007685E17|nr:MULTISPECIES: MaoC family dehydratase [Microbacterium]KXC05908.1 enoyl-CoA hydratase [Microbacterium hominis]QOC27075.1 MaoC family dehydratase [Microbacterium hominis]QOC28232.1 MaoC family dehydratase [Microbacterium hominis]QYF96589.1 MaoC family dehydratase [Microbacterium sp. PAMC21962]